MEKSMTETMIVYGQDIMKETFDITEQAKALKIITVKDFELSGEVVLSLARIKNQINAAWKPMLDKAKASLQEIKDNWNKELAPIEEAESKISFARVYWKIEQDRLERIEQDRKEAKEKADKDRERQALLDKAANMEKLNPKKAEELFRKAENIVEKPVFVEKAVEKTTITKSGGKITWVSDIKVTIINPKRICEGIAKDFIPAGCVEFKGLKAFAKMNNIKGEFWGLLVEDDTRESKRI